MKKNTKEPKRVHNDYIACTHYVCDISKKCKRAFIYDKRAQHAIFGDFQELSKGPDCGMFDERKDASYIKEKESNA